MSAFIKSIQNTAHTHHLWSKGSKILVGVSGGPDSVCLLDILVVLSKKYDWELRIAHVNYSLRGKDSAADERFVKGLAKRHSIPCSVLKPKITGTNNLEEVLRDIRYDFFEKTRQKHHLDTIAIAHTLDDQAETVLMRLIRGSGLSGLRAMQPKTGTIIRPFLETSRKDIMSYLKKQGLIYRIDASNEDMRFLRNRIRHKLLPYLRENFNPSIQDVLAHTAHIVGEDYNTLLSFAELCPIIFHQEEQTISFQASDLLALSISMQKMILRNFFTILRGDVQGICGTHTNEVLKMLSSDKSKIKTLSFQGLTVTYRGTTVTMRALLQK
ncbi:MAG: tRNA lysidine(34) synthetase TilS [Candidatus Moranbacteria bacterium]|nr:tRNA lysidine(34) synthetase TilS [Candidatus Moranbacteria bacterium]